MLVQYADAFGTTTDELLGRMRIPYEKQTDITRKIIDIICRMTEEEQKSILPALRLIHPEKSAE